MRVLDLIYKGNHHHFTDVIDGRSRWYIYLAVNPSRATLPSNECVEANDLPHAHRLSVKVIDRDVLHLVVDMGTGATQDMRDEWIAALGEKVSVTQ